MRPRARRARALGACLSVCLAALGCAFGGVPPAYDWSARESLRIPGGERCLELLSNLGVAHSRLAPRGGMAAPVSVHGPIAGVRYTNGGRAALTCDCRLVLALHWAAPIFQSFGVTEVEHFGAYASRTTRSGRPSLHALGLAIDVAHFSFPDGTRSVLADYATGFGDGCGDEAPVLNRVVCALRGTRLFRELITPDHDADHRDHVHLAISPP